MTIHAQLRAGYRWLERYRNTRPVFVCVLGFTETALVPGISAAGATPDDRRTTAIADAEFLIDGPRLHPKYPLPPLSVGVSPVFIARTVTAGLNWPVYLFSAGLPQQPTVRAIPLGGCPARCVSTGDALPPAIAQTLFARGWNWGERLARAAADSYIILSECVVGGTTTALAVLAGLGIDAFGKVNSSHPQCNHAQKWELVHTGLARAGLLDDCSTNRSDPLAIASAVGDPMQIAVAGMASAASHRCGVLLAGGTQMLAVFALLQALDRANSQRIAVGTTRWVAEDPTGDTAGLARAIGTVPLLATDLSLAAARHTALRSYERGFVKEGVGAGGCAIAAHLSADWSNAQLLAGIEATVDAYQHTRYQDRPQAITHPL
nr:TIGR00303 family protein [Rubidibacter lacunae]